MNKEAQRIAIAEACGWKDCGLHNNPLDGDRNWWAGFVPNRIPLLRQSLPDYLNDLNAMHEAEERVLTTIAIQGDYLNWIVANIEEDTEWDLAHATAAQRAEAFLKTIGKWAT